MFDSRQIAVRLRRFGRHSIFALLLMGMLFSPLAAFAYDDVRTPMYSVDYPSASQYNPVALPADIEDPWISYRDPEPRQWVVNVRGVLPAVTPAFGESYSDINDRIRETEVLLIQDARRVRARSVTFSHVVHETDDVISIVINAYVSSVISRNLVRSINFCPHTGEFMTIRDATDMDIAPLAMRILIDRMRRSPEQFYGVPSVVITNQAFFVNNVGITILFDEFQLSSMVSGYYSLELPHSRLQEAFLPADRVYFPTGNNYNLIMVPLRYVAAQLGYRVHWNQDLLRATVWHDSEPEPQRLAWMQVGVNAYHISDDMHRPLEAPPHIAESGAMYVPITFFEQILPFSIYNRDSYGNIIFLAYVGD